MIHSHTISITVCIDDTFIWLPTQNGLKYLDNHAETEHTTPNYYLDLIFFLNSNFAKQSEKIQIKGFDFANFA